MRKIRLTESQLNRIVLNCAKRIIRESEEPLLEFEDEEEYEEEDDEETDRFLISVSNDDFDGAVEHLSTFHLTEQLNGTSVADTLKRLALKAVSSAGCDGNLSVVILPIGENEHSRVDEYGRLAYPLRDEVWSGKFEVYNGQIKEK